MAVSVINRRCTCGYTRFRQARTAVETDVERWMEFDSSDLGGLGATPMGVLLGASLSSSSWGLFESTLRYAVLDLICESCARVQISQRLGGIAVFATYVEDGYLYVVASDVVKPATCFVLRFVGEETFDVDLLLLPGLTPPVVDVVTIPGTVAASPPAGAQLANKLLRARLPEASISGEYVVYLVDRCCDCVEEIATVTLEAPVMIFTALDADLNGAPRAWIHGATASVPAAQAASGSRVSIPFDHCDAVHEFDARHGTLPAAQSWTHQGAGASGDYALVEGGALRGETTTDSYWQRTTALAASPNRAYAYAKINAISAPGGSPGDGVDFQARYAPAVAAAYQGVRFTHHDERLYFTKLDASAEVEGLALDDAPGWLEVAAGQDDVNNTEAAWRQTLGFQQAALYGTQGAAGAIEVVSRFGDTAGNGITALIRNFVASYGGRFIRAGFTAYAPVSAPVLRLYLVSDTTASADKLARFKVRYGTALADPYALPTATAEATMNFSSANAVLVATLNLSGLTANTPFWFTVERDWTHADDTTPATIHLLQATIRSQ